METQETTYQNRLMARTFNSNAQRLAYEATDLWQAADALESAVAMAERIDLDPRLVRRMASAADNCRWTGNRKVHETAADWT